MQVSYRTVVFGFFIAMIMIVSRLTPTALQSGLAISADSAPRHYFAFFPAGSTEAGFSGYLADGSKRSFIHLPLYEKDAMAATSFAEVKRIQSIILGPRRASGESVNRPVSVIFVGQKKPVSIYLREALLVSDSGLITQLTRLEQEGTLSRVTRGVSVYRPLAFSEVPEGQSMRGS